MPSNFFGSRLSLITPIVTSSATLVITSGAVTLINRGTTTVTVTDGMNAVTGCTLIISDGTKATSSGQKVLGSAESGTYTVIASKAGYANSAAVTFTCSGGLVLDLDPRFGTNTTTNGASVTSWVDQSPTGATFSEVVAPPTYLLSGLNGSPAILANGTTQKLSTATLVSALNPSSFTWVLGFQSSSDGGASNRSPFGNLANATNTGFNCLLNTTNGARAAVGTGTTTATLTTANNTALAATGHYMSGVYNLTGTVHAGDLDGVLITGSPQTTAYAPNITTDYWLFANNAGTGNFFPGAIYRHLLYNRAVTATELTQAELTVKTLMGL